MRKLIAALSRVPYMAIAIIFAFAMPAASQILLNEVEVDTPNDSGEVCEYIEVRGTPSSTVPANTFFISIDGDAGQFGFVTYIANISGAQFGTNGTITIITNSDVCVGRSYPAATTIVQSDSIAMGFGAETFLLVTTTQPGMLFEGADVDTNNDGVLDAAFGLTPIDGIGWTLDPSAVNTVYGGVPKLFQGPSTDVPDAATRFSSNLNPFSAAAWYYGELAPPETSTTYTAPLSPNFPVAGGMLTPGAPNIPPTAADGLLSGTITDEAGRPISGVVVQLSGSQTRKTITDSSGVYRFSNVETTGFYVVTPSHSNYSFAPSNRSFSLLGNKTEAAFTGRINATALNPIEAAEFFIRQQYVDVLGREPDEPGLNFWSNQILACELDRRCLNARRRDIAAEFFITREFQLTGLFVYEMYSGALGRSPDFNEFVVDRAQVIGSASLDIERAAFARSFVQRPEFVDKYQAHTTAAAFVDALLENVWLSAGLRLDSERDTLIARFNIGDSQTESRSLVLRELVDNPSFKQTQYNAAFVLTEYSAYLRRNPDPEGYEFWLRRLNSDKSSYPGMVCAFITSKGVPAAVRLFRTTERQGVRTVKELAGSSA